MVDSGRIRLPMAIDAKVRKDFSLFRSSGQANDESATPRESGFQPDITAQARRTR
jgi:hypothetical protein